ncbi:ABC transporter permease [Spirochaeta dissipatitropha]
MNGYTIHLRRILRNKLIMAATLAIPLLMLMYGYIGTDNLPRVAVIAEDSGPLAELVLDKLSETYRIELIETDRAAVIIRQGAADYVLHIHEDFGAKLLRAEMPVLSGRSAQSQQYDAHMRAVLSGIIQPALMLSGSINPASEQEFVESLLAELPAERSIEQQADIYGSGVSSRAAERYQSGMNLFSMIMLLMGLYGGMNLIRDRHSGTIMRASATPSGLRAYMAGLLAALLSVQLLQVAASSVVSVLVFPEIGPAIAVRGFVVMAVFALTGISFGIAIAGVAKNMNQLGVLGSIFIFPMSVLGGSILPVDIMPDFMQRAALLVPNYWAGLGVKAAMEQGATADFLLPIGILVAFAAVFFLLGTWKREQLTSGREMRA